jgi:Na+-driven multidrug efflux pump
MNCVGDCQQRLLINFGKSKITFICSLSGLFVHILDSYLFVIYLDMGIKGTGYAAFVTNTFTLMLMIYFT